MVLEQNYEDTFTLNILSVALGNIVAATWNLPKLQHEKLSIKLGSKLIFKTSMILK